MKKIVSLLLLLFMISGCQSASTNRIVSNNELSGIQQVDYDTLQTMLKSDQLFILYIGRDDCRDCQTFNPILEEYLNEHPGQYVYYLNIKEFRDQARSENATQQQKDFYENIQKELDFSWVPILKFVNNGETIDEYTYLSEDYYNLDDDQKQEALEKYNSDLVKWMESKFE